MEQLVGCWLIPAAFIVTLGGFVQGASGFGSGLVIMGLLPFIMDTKDAAIVMPLIAPFFIAVLLWRLRRHIRLRPVLPCIITAFVVGLPLGLLTFIRSDASVLKIIIGLSLVVFCTYNLFRREEMSIAGNWKRASLVGVLSGFLTGATNTGGPPIVLYFYMQHLPKERTSAALQTYFLVAMLYKVVVLSALGQVRERHVELASFFLVFVVVGMLLGFALFKRIDTDRLRRAVYIMLVVVGVVLVLRGGWLDHRNPEPRGPEEVQAPATTTD